MAKLEGGESILLHSLADLPPEAQSESDHLKQLGVRSMAAIPILHENMLAGFLCFMKAHQDGEWVTEDIRLLQLLANIFFNTIVHSLEEQLLLRRSAILEAVRLTAEYFLASSDWHDCIQEVLRCLGEASAVSRVYLFENHQAEDGTHLTSQRFEWCAPGVEPQINNPRLQNAPLLAPEFALLSKTVGRGETICGLTRDFTGPERSFLEAQGIRAIVIVPVNVQGVWWGFLGFDECLAERAWHPAEIGSLQAAANILGASIQRQLIAESLLQSRRRYRSLFEDSPISLWEQDFSGVREILTALKQADVADLRSYLKQRPETVAACMAAIRVININQATIDLYKIENEQQFRTNLSSFFSSEAADVFIEELVAIAAGKTSFESQSVNYKANGERMDILLKWSVAPGFEGSLQKVYISIQDITEAVRVENELRQQRAYAEALVKVAAALNNTLHLDEVLERILNSVDEVLPHHIASLALVDAGIISQVRTRGYNQASQEKFMNSWRLPVNGTPISRRMAETGQAVVVPDTWLDPDWIIIEERKWVRSFAGAPIQINNETAGFIFLDSATPGFFKPEHAAQLQAFAYHASIAIHNARLFESARQLAHNLQLLNDIIQAALETTSYQSMLQTLADNLGKLLNADGAFITLWDETRQLTIPAAAYGALRDSYPRFIGTPGELTLTSSVLSAGRPIAIEDVSNSPYINPSITMNFSTKSLLGIPLIAGERKLGGALIAFNQTHQFQPDEIKLAEQAAHPIALAVYKMQLLDAEQQQRKLAEALRASAMALNATH
ncbi:MAG: GAF domain-containing protein, partial [Anaerolineaceae bacterium]|nr:GAF domain-containing protein [Anaerolineaceae bacterium]